MVFDYFNNCPHARSLGIAAQIKIMGELLLVFSDQWFRFIRLFSRKYKVVYERRKSLKTFCSFLDFIL
jgi:hypothetical protein